MIYKRKETANGRVQYWIGEKLVEGKLIKGKMTKPENIPEAILNQLEGNMEIEIGAPVVEDKAPDQAPQIRREDRTCFIDGEPGKFKKFLELKTVYLCEEHHRNLTTGEVVFEMRKAGILDKD